MNISEFAEKVVFSNSLEDKLAPPGKLSLARNPSSSLPSSRSLRTPGRPENLLMVHQPGRNQQPPRDHQLENEKSRGQLLHFLANHELLATELMALVLLKFPDAPTAFRQGVLVTLQEEQQHTRMYLQRMEECGVEFGTWPVSGQFWRMVEPMQTPMDFVSRLSLTFEQANLDYSRHFASVFERIGDLKTSKLLSQIYKDEISHVQHGLHWFRQWKDPQKSDFDAWTDTLTFPMSPARARGPRSAFNREGRRAAGLGDEFIDAVEIFGQSKDRSAAVRWFDPSPESELSGKSDRLLDELGRELEFVCLALCKPDDVLLVRDQPSGSLSKHWLDAGIELPEFCRVDELNSLTHRKLNHYQPWAMTPKNCSAIVPIADSFRHRPPAWNPSLEKLFHKSWGVAALARWITDGPLPPWMGASECVGIAVGQDRQLSDALAQLAGQRVSTACYKPDLSASGRGMYRIETGQANFKQAKQTEPAVVEPFLDRIVDVSFLWNISTQGKPRFLGWTRPLISQGGRYEGTVLGRPFFDCDVEVRKFLLGDRCGKLRETAQWLESRLLPELNDAGLVGNFGVDAFVYRDADRQLKMRPFVELNPRTTMGHVALALEKRIANGVKAEFRILTQSQYLQQRDRLESLQLDCDDDGRWRSGVVWLGQRSDVARLIPCVVVGHKKSAGL